MSDEFLAHRRMLLGLAYRLLGTLYDAEDVLQEAYLRWTRADRSEVVEPRRYLTRVVARLAVDALRARQARREQYIGTWLPEPLRTPDTTAVDVDDVSIAVLHMMERLTPPQRAVYVLRNAFELPYAEIAGILERAEDDCRQLHRRAAAALEGRARFSTDQAEHARLLEGFMAAARTGDVERLEALLHEDVVAWNDGGGKVRTGPNPIRGRAKVVRFFTAVLGRHATTTTRTGVNGDAALLVEGNYRYAMVLCVVDGRIHDLFRIANPTKLSTFADDGPS